MLALVYCAMTLAACAFGWLGLITGYSRRFTWELWFAMGIAFLATFVPLAAPSHDWTFLPICGPWLLGVALGKLASCLKGKNRSAKK